MELNSKMLPALRLVFFGFVIALAVGFFLPKQSVGGVAEAIFGTLYVDIPTWLFETLRGFTADLKASGYEGYGAFKTFLWMLAWLATIAASLVIPLAFMAYVTFLCWASVTSVFPRLGFGVICALGGNQSPTMQNIGHVVMGRATLQETIDAEVQANAIAEALNRKQ